MSTKALYRIVEVIYRTGDMFGQPIKIHGLGQKCRIQNGKKQNERKELRGALG